MIEAAETFEKESLSREQEVKRLREYISANKINESQSVNYQNSHESHDTTTHY